MKSTWTKDRLASIRMQHIKWSAMVDTSSWESTFLLDLIDGKNKEIRQLKSESKKLSNLNEDLRNQLEGANRRVSAFRLL